MRAFNDVEGFEKTKGFRREPLVHTVYLRVKCHNENVCCTKHLGSYATSNGILSKRISHVQYSASKICRKAILSLNLSYN